MTKVIVSGYYGFNNAGDEAVLAAIVAGLKQVLPSPEIVVLSAKPEMTAQQYHVRSIKRTNIMALWQELKKASLFISGGGSLLQDVTGALTIPYYLGLVSLALTRKVPVLFFSQGVGPINGKLGRSLAKRVLSRVELITVRDENSQQLLREIGIADELIRVTADPVLFLNPALDERVKEIAIREHIPYNEKGPWIGVSLRPWDNEEHYTATVARALDRLIDEYSARVVFIPFHFQKDRETIEKTRIRMHNFDSTHVVENSYSPQELLGLMQMFDVVLGMRLHSLIFAARQKIVPVGISYDPKVDAFLKRIDTEVGGTTEHISDTLLMHKMAKVLEMTDDDKKQFEERVEQLQRDAWQAIRYAKDLAIGARI